MPSDNLGPCDHRLPAGERCGLVVRVTRGGRCEVHVDGQVVTCRVRARAADAAGLPVEPVVVGDRVRIAPSDDGSPEATIVAVEPRTSRVGRGRWGKQAQVIAANVDQVAIVLSARSPDFGFHTLDRYLVLVEVAGVEPLVVLNKCDLDPAGEVRGAVRDVYEPLGYPLCATSAVSGEGLAELAAKLAGRISAVVGPSGTGKSSLLNALNPSYRLRTGEVMAIGKGRHTTSERRLLPLDQGGWVADTPGIKSLALLAEDLDPREVQHLFPELDALFGRCRFADCRHAEEPDCAVTRAVAEGLIAPSRYESYRRLVDELEQARRR